MSEFRPLRDDDPPGTVLYRAGGRKLGPLVARLRDRVWVDEYDRGPHTWRAASMFVEETRGEEA